MTMVTGMPRGVLAVCTIGVGALPLPTGSMSMAGAGACAPALRAVMARIAPPGT
jgi:hypothetical protein